MEESIKEYQRRKSREYYWANPEKYRAKSKLDNKKYHKEKRIYRKEYYKKNREHLLLSSKLWVLNNKERAISYRRERIQIYRSEVLKILGSVCCKCGFSDKRALQIDHINGGGSAEFRKYGNSKAFYVKIKSTLSEYQLLCANCNWIKRHENKEY